MTWLWRGNREYRPRHVNVLAAMLRRHLTIPHRFVCITDETEGFSSDVEVMPTPGAARALGELSTPEGAGFPSCYRRLWMFSDEARALGDRVLLLDVDLVLIGNIDHLITDDSFIGWQPKMTWGHGPRIAGGMYLMKTGAHVDVFDDFQGQRSISHAARAGFRGSDQAWISYKMLDRAKFWPAESGIYSIRDLRFHLPADARLVQFNGTVKPWNSHALWVRRHWR